jgi:hypothetical protein
MPGNRADRSIKVICTLNLMALLGEEVDDVEALDVEHEALLTWRCVSASRLLASGIIGRKKRTDHYFRPEDESRECPTKQAGPKRGGTYP